MASSNNKRSTFELKASYNGLDYNEGYTGLTKEDFNQDPYQRYVGSQLDQMNANAITYYGKVHAELFDGIRNTTTLYYNYFSRDWFKLDKVGAQVMLILFKMLLHKLITIMVLKLMT